MSTTTASTARVARPAAFTLPTRLGTFAVLATRKGEAHVTIMTITNKTRGGVMSERFANWDELCESVTSSFTHEGHEFTANVSVDVDANLCEVYALRADVTSTVRMSAAERDEVLASEYEARHELDEAIRAALASDEVRAQVRALFTPAA